MNELSMLIKPASSLCNLRCKYCFYADVSENRDIAMKLLFFARDIRGGLGERRVFKVILNWLAKNEPQTVRKNIE